MEMSKATLGVETNDYTIKAGKYTKPLALLAGLGALCEDRPGRHHPEPLMQVD